MNMIKRESKTTSIHDDLKYLLFESKYRYYIVGTAIALLLFWLDIISISININIGGSQL